MVKGSSFGVICALPAFSKRVAAAILQLLPISGVRAVVHHAVEYKCAGQVNFCRIGSCQDFAGHHMPQSVVALFVADPACICRAGIRMMIYAWEQPGVRAGCHSCTNEGLLWEFIHHLVATFAFDAACCSRQQQCMRLQVSVKSLRLNVVLHWRHDR